MVLLDGKKVSDEIIENIKSTIDRDNLKIGFAIIWIGNNEASGIYVRNKIKKCDYLGIKSELYHLDEGVSEDEVLSLIDKLNNRNDINGIIVQSPAPKHIDIIECFNRIDASKDVDGFSNISVSNLYQGKPNSIACTPRGIIRLLNYYNIDLTGKNVCIVNRSLIIGKPLMHLLLMNDATVTICHSKTKDVSFHTKQADIVISAVGIPKFITRDMVKDGAIVIDVGISRVDGKVVGDVDFENVADKTSYISKVPGGVGPMTMAMIFENLVNIVKEK